MFENPIEAAVLSVVAVIIYSLIKTAIEKVFKSTRSGDDFVTRDELIAFCQRTQMNCPARSVVQIVQTGMEELRKELRAEMESLRQLVISVIRENRHEDRSGKRDRITD